MRACCRPAPGHARGGACTPLRHAQSLSVPLRVPTLEISEHLWGACARAPAGKVCETIKLCVLFENLRYLRTEATACTRHRCWYQ